ncbi:unnamed protein product [Peronospora destructor]|uniref:Uncharacterized protein n=1 Tax=Peronospora destructor TaxID=86335 RepID=A0AAV0V422_9STRA|nr:unnamed protein product [Peronospora destructor]
MVKSNERLATAAHEFALLEKALIQTADDAVRCLKLLKKNLSDYDHHHGNHFINTTTSFMRNDMRTTKDTASNLKHVAHLINENPQPFESDIDLRTQHDECCCQVHGRSQHDSSMIKEEHEKDDKHASLLDTNDDRDTGGLLGKRDGHHHHGGGILSSSDTVEQLVKTTLHDNFNISALSHQITIAQKSLSSSPSFVERAKEVIHDVKDKLKGDTTSPTHDGHHGNKHVVERKQGY